jgi:hypothetical protein
VHLAITASGSAGRGSKKQAGKQRRNDRKCQTHLSVDIFVDTRMSMPDGMFFKPASFL